MSTLGSRGILRDHCWKGTVAILPLKLTASPHLSDGSDWILGFRCQRNTRLEGIASRRTCSCRIQMVTCMLGVMSFILGFQKGEIFIHLSEGWFCLFSISFQRVLSSLGASCQASLMASHMSADLRSHLLTLTARPLCDINHTNVQRCISVARRWI